MSNVPASEPPPGEPAGAAGAPTPAGASGPRADFGQRLLAWLVDGVLISAIGFVLAGMLGEQSANLINAAIGLIYYIYLEGSPSGQTVGKKLLGIRVVDFASGDPIGFGRATVRYFARILSALPLGLGYLWMLWDKEKQTWHDKLSTSVVAPVSAYPVDEWPG
jgi:uncharacterized RDD family membrane protein YckC